jgi:Zn-finger nucleic acid-binding protein
MKINSHKIDGELKKVVSRVRTAQTTLHSVLKNQKWVEDARKYAEKQSREVRKLLSSDLGKVKTFLERERKDLERFQRQIPGEVKKLRDFVKGQRRELEKLLKNVRAAGKGAKKAKSAPRKKAKSRSASASAS